MDNTANLIIPQAAIQTTKDATPIISQALNITPTLMGGTTNAKVYDQGYTYNQSGFTYNQPGVAYGGVYNINQDIIPIISQALNITPLIFSSSDMYTQPEKAIGKNGPGFFLFINMD